MSWMVDALCTQVDPDMFFPDVNAMWVPTRTAKRICEGCPVRRECLEDSPVWDKWSIRGGMTPLERQQWRRTAA